MPTQPRAPSPGLEAKTSRATPSKLSSLRRKLGKEDEEEVAVAAAEVVEVTVEDAEAAAVVVVAAAVAVMVTGPAPYRSAVIPTSPGETLATNAHNRDQMVLVAVTAALEVVVAAEEDAVEIVEVIEDSEGVVDAVVTVEVSAGVAVEVAVEVAATEAQTAETTVVTDGTDLIKGPAFCALLCTMKLQFKICTVYRNILVLCINYELCSYN